MAKNENLVIFGGGDFDLGDFLAFVVKLLTIKVNFSKSRLVQFLKIVATFHFRRTHVLSISRSNFSRSTQTF